MQSVGTTCGDVVKIGPDVSPAFGCICGDAPRLLSLSDRVAVPQRATSQCAIAPVTEGKTS